ncbi:MAG: DUF5367 family protein [Microcystaceae cyanobacterium]
MIKNLNVKRAVLSSIIVYLFAVTAFVGSFFVPLMSNPELQANLALMIAIIPAASLGAHIYYRKDHQTNGFVLGVAMFIGAIILDALITVPVFIMPNGGNHITFFGNLGFWLIGVEYISVVAVYKQIEKVVKYTRVKKV